MVACTAAVTGHAQQRVSVAVEWPESPTPYWSLGVADSGEGYFTSDKRTDMGRNIKVSRPVLDRLMSGFATVNSGHCETRQKNIAHTGVKHVVYEGKTTASCDFNYSDDERLNDAVAAATAIMVTMRSGDELVHARRFDRLSLDTVMDTFYRAWKEGRAIEVQNVQPLLESLVADDHVIDRVRRKASAMLESLRVPAQAAPEPVRLSPR